MSLISGKYWTGDTKIKPEAWGPVSSVQSTIYNNADNFGINPKDAGVLLLLWEKAGKFPLNYGSLPLQPFRAGTDSNSVPWAHEGLDCVNDYRKFALQTASGTVRFPYSGHVHMRIKNRAALGGNNYLFYFRDGATNSRLGLNLSYGDVLYFAHGDVYTSSSLGSLGVDVGDIFDLSVNYSPSGLDIYVNGEFFTTAIGNSWSDTGAGLNRYGFLDIDGTTNYGYSNGDVYIYQHFTTELTSDQIAVLSDNPYAMIQPPTLRTYFIPDGDVTLYPTIIYPLNGSSDVTQPITFSWTSVTDATYYQLQVADTEAKLDTDPVVDTTTTAPTTTKEVSGLGPSTIYYARVRAQLT